MPDAHVRGWGDPSSTGYRSHHITAVHVAGLPTLYLRTEVAHLFMGFLQEIAARGFKFNARTDDWGYALRPIRGYEAKWASTHDFHWLSNHSWGLALDLDATDHPLGRRNTGIPRWVVDCAHKWGLSWGGDYVNRPDEMHFEFLGTPADVARYPLLADPPAPPAPQPSPHHADEEDDMPWVYRDATSNAVYFVNGRKRVHIEKPALDELKRAGVVPAVDPAKVAGFEALFTEGG